MTYNENNYPGATTILVGYAAGNPEYPPYDREGKRGFKQLSVAVNEGYKPKDGGDFVQTGTTWYRIEKHEDAWAELGVGKGDKIRLDGAKQEVREYQDKNGDSKLGITLTYGDLMVLESKNGGSASDEEAPF
jgi:hypothetical protein